MRGIPPHAMLEISLHARKFFINDDGVGANGIPRSQPLCWALKPEADYAAEQGCALCRNKQYFKYAGASSCHYRAMRAHISHRGSVFSHALISLLIALPELIMNHPSSKAVASEAVEKSRREAMLHFCEGLLQLSPATRWTPQQVHSFVFLLPLLAVAISPPYSRTSPPPCVCFPSKALLHPFITGDMFSGSFDPPNENPINVSSSPHTVNTLINTRIKCCCFVCPLLRGGRCSLFHRVDVSSLRGQISVISCLVRSQKTDHPPTIAAAPPPSAVQCSPPPWADAPHWRRHRALER